MDYVETKTTPKLDYEAIRCDIQKAKQKGLIVATEKQIDRNDEISDILSEVLRMLKHFDGRPYDQLSEALGVKRTTLHNIMCNNIREPLKLAELTKALLTEVIKNKKAKS
jgi:hypothetical protein